MENAQLNAMAKEAGVHLNNKLLPFWKALKDEEFGGFYGYMDYDLNLDKKAVKGCILNSRILWFFSNAAMVLKDDSLIPYADHAYEFMTKYCLDRENGGIYWSMNYDGTVADSTKHTYNQAFAIYALSSYYDLTKKREALDEAFALRRVIEEKCTDEYGYLEAFDREFKPAENDKLSENGVMADKTMNTLLHVLEAYTELYRVSGDARQKDYLERILSIWGEKIYNPELRRQEVFFDTYWNSIIDLHSYGHDIETAWLVDRALEILADEDLSEKLAPCTDALAARIYERAYVNHSILNECERGKDDKKRVWWVQAEGVVSFLNSYMKDNSRTDYLKASTDMFRYVMDYQTDKREGSEWFMWTDENGLPIKDAPIVEPWKCPYHNGRMCFEIIKRYERLKSEN